MKVIYYVFSEATAEEDAFFDENDQLLARWNGNDAAWRPHYMEPLLDKLGIEVVHATGEHKERLLEILRKLFIEEQGYDPYGAESVCGECCECVIDGARCCYCSGYEECTYDYECGMEDDERKEG